MLGQSTIVNSPNVDRIGLGVANRITGSSSQIDTPVRQRAAQSGTDPLDAPQRAARLGDAIPIVFGRRVGNIGGVLISPVATEARFENNLDNDVTVYYHFVLSEGYLRPIQVRDVFQQSCRVGRFTQAYDRRAGAWSSGNFLVQRGTKPLPEATIYCGTGRGSYAGLTTGSFINTIPDGFDQWNRQVHMFVRGGVHVTRIIDNEYGPSGNIVDLVLYLLQRTSRVPADLIDTAAMQRAAIFADRNGFACNIELKAPTNLADWLADTLPYFLLRESRSSGKRGLKPLLPTNSDGSIKTTQVDWLFRFTDDHVVPGTLQIAYTNRAQRRPFTADIIWRQQPEDALGLARSTEVRYRNANNDDPFEQHDLSAFCTSERHAVRVGAYIISRRRHVSHRLTIDVRPGPYLATLEPGDIVRVTLRREDSTGGIQIHDFLYEIDRIANAPAGDMTLELTHFPVDNQGRSLVALDVEGARGRGERLETGRSDVNCDANSFEDITIEFDEGPPLNWEIPPLDPPIYGDLNDPSWNYDSGTGRWDYVGPAIPGWSWDSENQEWVFDGVDNPNWEWNPETGEWIYVGAPDPDWAWNQEDQQWDYVGEGDSNWEWNPDNNGWDYVGLPDSDWNWDRNDQEWDYVGDPGWQFDPETGNWDYVGDSGTDFEWNDEDQKWDYVGPGDPDWAWNRDNNQWVYEGTLDPDWDWNPGGNGWVYEGDPNPDWVWDEDDQEWGYSDPNWNWNEDLERWEFDGTPDPDWNWNEEEQKWEYEGDADENWNWDEEEQRWDFTGEEDEDWDWNEEEQEWDYIGEEEEDWEWDKEEDEWVFVDEEEEWIYDDEQDEFEFVGEDDPDWTWDQEDQEWEYVGEEEEDWEWNGEEDEWVYIGEEEVPPAPPEPPPSPRPQPKPDEPPAPRPEQPPADEPVAPPGPKPDEPPSFPPIEDDFEPDLPPIIPPVIPEDEPPVFPPIDPPEEQPFDPPVLTPEPIDADEWGDGPVEEFNPVIPDEPAESLTASVSFGAPIVRYPDVFYLVLQEDFALVTMEVTVDNAPRFTDLRLTLNNAGQEVSVVIRKGETRAVVNMNGSGTSLAGCTTRTVSIVRYEGGGYGSSGLNISATQTYQVCGYQGTITLSAATWTRDDGEWVPTVDPADWNWDSDFERWDYAGDAVANWSWSSATQEWSWTGVGAATGRPALPPPIPASLPPEGATTTVVARAAVDVPPVPNSANNLEIDINDVVVDGAATSQQAKGTIVINAVSPVVDGWRYNYATAAWDIVTLPGNGWRWDGSAWVYMGRIEPGYSYNSGTNSWTWSGEGDQPVAPPVAPTDTPPSTVPHTDWVNTRASVGELTYHV
jgi:hypothetical protein